jgi:predicted O-methyltransferase YrrM
MFLVNLFRRGFRSALFRVLRCLKRHGKASGTISDAFQFWYDLPVDPVHYYSPLPDISKARKNLARWNHENQLPAVNINVERQASFINKLKPFSSECASLPSFSKITKAGYGPGYGEVEAHFLHCMIRYLKPRRIIEVGSGVSTYFSLNALDMNEKDSERMVAEMHCIEPYPSKKLETLESEKRITLHVKEVQDVPTGFFESLGENDILFIDSTHAGKIDSDVYHIYLEILPRLKPGVVVHIHDIYFPYLTCPPEHPIFPLSMLWNENALCQAFLAFNDAFEILMCQSYLHYKQPSAISDVVSVYDRQRHFPSSLWLKRNN